MNTFEVAIAASGATSLGMIAYALNRIADVLERRERRESFR